jgi:hypothetical protein
VGTSSRTTRIDGIAKTVEDLRMEYVAVKMQLDRHDGSVALSGGP